MLGGTAGMEWAFTSCEGLRPRSPSTPQNATLQTNGGQIVSWGHAMSWPTCGFPNQLSLSFQGPSCVQTMGSLRTGCVW